MICFMLFVRLSYRCWLWERVVPCAWFRMGRAAGVVGLQRVFAHPGHLVPSLVFPGSCVSLVVLCFVSFAWFGHWYWLRSFPFTRLDTLILTADFSVYLIWIYWFWLLINAFEIGLTAGVTSPDPTFAFVGGLCCPELNFIFAVWIMITFDTLLTSIFCIR
jgi:hypothetical protein